MMTSGWFAKKSSWHLGILVHSENRHGSPATKKMAKKRQVRLNSDKMECKHLRELVLVN